MTLFTKEQLVAMVDEYVEKYEPRYKKVAAYAYEEGMIKMAEIIKQKLQEL